MSLAEARRRANMSQRDVAKRLQISASAVAQWEMGITQPKIKHLKQLSEMFDTSVDDLLKD